MKTWTRPSRTKGTLFSRPHPNYIFVFPFMIHFFTILTQRGPHHTMATTSQEGGSRLQICIGCLGKLRGNTNSCAGKVHLLLASNCFSLFAGLFSQLSGVKSPGDILFLEEIDTKNDGVIVTCRSSCALNVQLGRTILRTWMSSFRRAFGKSKSQLVCGGNYSESEGWHSSLKAITRRVGLQVSHRQLVPHKA